MSIGFYTLDVGHGLSHVIVLPGRRAIVIDGGSAKRADVTTAFLSAYVDKIVAYVATHHDEDHVGAALSFLEKYDTASTLESMWLLLDRGGSVPLVDYALKRREAKTLGVLRRVEAKGLSDPVLIHDEAELRLEVLFPDFASNIPSATSSGRRPRLNNATSAVLRASSGTHAILVTGDVDASGLKKVSDLGFSLAAEVLVVPHHGGHVHSKKQAKWEDLVAEIDPKLAVISNGRHPKLQRDTLKALAARRIPVWCTELGRLCDRAHERKAPGLLVSDGVPRWPDYSSNATSCRGSSLVTLTAAGLTLPRLDEHQRAVDRIAGTPLCRLASHSRKPHRSRKAGKSKRKRKRRAP